MMEHKGFRALVAAAVIAMTAAFWLFRVGSAVQVEIPAGQSAREIGLQLQRQGVIVSPALFRLLAKATRLDRDLKPGMFRLREHMSSLEALWRLTRERPEAVKIAIPEGFCARQIADRLDAAGVAGAKDFLGYVRANHLEGYLFPTTYYFPRGAAVEETARRMHQEFNREVEPVFRQFPAGSLSMDQAVTLASIIEREAVLPQEKPMIAAVYLNRLSQHRLLEADPTVQYALGFWKKRLSLADLKFESPYNTYVHPGLPPGPICSPGLESIRAVLRPAKTDALYFVADNTGGHTFNVSFEEHLKAKAKAARERRAKKL